MPPRKSSKESFRPKDLVLAKMPGFPAWPSFIMPKDMIPDAILKVNKKKTANTCVIFIPDGDYYWMNEKNLEPLDNDMLEARVKKIPAASVAKFKEKLKSKNATRSSSITDAFLSTKGLKFDGFMKQLDDRLRAADGNDDDDDEAEDGGEDEEDVEEEEEEEPVDEATTSTNQPPSDGEEVEEEEADHPPSNDGGNESDDDDASDIKEEDIQLDKRRSTRTTRGSSSEDNNKRTPRNGKSNGGRRDGIEKRSDDEVITGKRRAGNTSDQDNTNDNINTTSLRNKRFKTESPGPVSKSSSNNSVNNYKRELTDEERLQQLWLCRIKLQKSLIQRDKDDLPNADELSTSRLILKKLVDFKVNLDLLKTTKIHKVLKCIIKNKDLEYPESFKLHDQCQELLQKWAGLIEEIKLEKTAIYLNKQRQLQANVSGTTDDNEVNDKKFDESEISDTKSVKSPNELKFASVES